MYIYTLWFFTSKNFYCNATVLCYFVLRKTNKRLHLRYRGVMQQYLSQLVYGVDSLWQFLWSPTRAAQSCVVPTQSQCRLSFDTLFSCCWGLSSLHRLWLPVELPGYKAEQAQLQGSAWHLRFCEQ